MISRHDKHGGSSAASQLRRKPFGEVHLKVSSVRESRSDDKRFSIFTGTKRLHLRAETREDRATWVEALLAIKDMFPRMSNSELMAPIDNLAMSTEKLRQRLVDEGVSELAIQDCEQIMRSEFSALQSQLVLLKQKQWLLIDTLRHLETEKVDLENTVVDESQRHTENEGPNDLRNEKFSEGTATESDDENERGDAETDEEDHTFFDTRDFLSSSSFKSSSSGFRTSSFSSDDDGFGSEDDIDPSIKSVGFNYPRVKRRKSLPDPVEKEKSVSLWSMIKDNIGKDLTKVCLPVYFNEPLSSLQKCFEDLEYSYLLDRAFEWGKRGNTLMRILNVAAFAVSGYASTEGRICKPFNPLLGETYEADYPDKGLRFFSEKVSHHPMVVACHCDGTGWKFWADSNLKSKFWGRSIQLDPVGVLTLKFDDGEILQWSKVTTSIYNLILGKLYCDHYGTMRIEGNAEYSCKLKFKEQSIIDRNPHQTEKVDLENTLVDESQRQAVNGGSIDLRHEKCSEGTATESDDDHERGDAETDEEDNTFFDTRDFLSSSSFKSSGSDFRTSSFSSDGDGFGSSEDDIDPSIKSIGCDYPHVKRRKSLPEPVEKEKSVSLWSMIKDNIGKDLTKVCLPVYFNEPLSSLQKCFEDLEYSYLLDRAFEWGKRVKALYHLKTLMGSFLNIAHYVKTLQGNSLMRILNVAAFAVSGYASTEGRICKPFNPLLGETYEADYPDKGLRFFSEKVSHHPMVVACHCDGTGWKFWADSNLKSKFWGRSIQLDPVGVLTLQFDDGEILQWSKVTTSIYNLILGKLYCDHYGTMRIEGSAEYSCKLKFKEQSIIDRNPHQVHGIVQDKSGKTVATMFGKWDESMHYVTGDCSGKGKLSEDMSGAQLLWKRSKPPGNPTKYNLTRFAMTLNELTPGLKFSLSKVFTNTSSIG
ncbi:hypothetical protein F2Q68_00002204 [Brassica cretica]|uniref:PH domain-containing protein n=1 Tax=Brassica cretica TaxID=69181 RepID=A0A8S9J9Y8_BRACR|nr:hypothetical protein F2Q68_00002204 [Brassica cretica]